MKTSRWFRLGHESCSFVRPDDHVHRASRDLGAAPVRGPSNAPRSHGARNRQIRLRGILDFSRRERPGDVDDLRAVGDAGGPRRACPIGRLPPPSGGHRPLSYFSGDQLRRSPTHRRSRSGAGLETVAAAEPDRRLTSEGSVRTPLHKHRQISIAPETFPSTWISPTPSRSSRSDGTRGCLFRNSADAAGHRKSRSPCSRPSGSWQDCGLRSTNRSCEDH